MEKKVKTKQKSRAILSLGIFILSGCLSFGNSPTRPRCDIYNFGCVDRVPLQEPDSSMEVLGAVFGPSSLSSKTEKAIEKAIAGFIKKLIKSKPTTNVGAELTEAAARELVDEIGPIATQLGREIAEFELEAAIQAWRRIQAEVTGSAPHIIRANAKAITQLREYLNSDIAPSKEVLRKIKDGLASVGESKRKSFQYLSRANREPQNTSSEFTNLIEQMWGGYSELEMLSKQLLDKFGSLN